MTWSVVIPVLNEQSLIARCLENLRQKMPQAEIIVVDGGSHDGTWEWLQSQEGIKHFQCEKGRGLQLNYGASQAKGKYMLFLHVDSELPQTTDSLMEKILNQAYVSAGAFSLGVDHPAWRYRLMEKLVWLRCAIFRLPYGDQGLFFLKEKYLSVGGIPKIPIMEDVSLCRLFKKIGSIQIAPEKIKTSARRIEARGFLRSCTRNLVLVTLFHLGVTPHFLRRMYERG